MYFEEYKKHCPWLMDNDTCFATRKSNIFCSEFFCAPRYWAIINAQQPSPVPIDNERVRREQKEVNNG